MCLVRTLDCPRNGRTIIMLFQITTHLTPHPDFFHKVYKALKNYRQLLHMTE